MKPEIYFQIALLMLRSGFLTSAFSIPEFLAHGGGSVPFIALLSSRRFRQFFRKQHLQCQLAIVGIFILTVGCGYVIVSIDRKSFNYFRAELKKFRKLKKFENSLRKCSKMKNKFSSKPKVQFILVT